MYGKIEKKDGTGMKEILLINVCVRKQSRTLELARYLLSFLDGHVTEVRPAEMEFPVSDEAFLEKRDRLIRENATDDVLFEQARQFAKADMIVIAAPYWDLSFPAALKQYFEQVNVIGITFRYTPEGIPEGLCKAKKIWYVMTAGGMFAPEEYGCGYVRALAEGYYGIHEIKLYKALGLDIVGADPEEIMRQAKKTIAEDFAK